MKKNNRRGFTITELVIVIAVIAILAAVLIPTFSGVINKANQSAALQKAKNAYTAYVGSIDYASGATLDTDMVIVADGYYFVVEDGSLQSTANTTNPKPAYKEMQVSGEGLDTVPTQATTQGG